MERFTETAVGSTGYVAAQGYTPPKGHTVATSGYISADICDYRLPRGLCQMMGKPCPTGVAGDRMMANNREDYWSNEIKSYDGQLHTGPDDTHDWWKWREFLKLGRILNAEIKCKVRMA